MTDDGCAMCHSWVPAVVETRIPAAFETCIPAEIENSVLGHVELDRQSADATVELMTINSSPSSVWGKLVSRSCQVRCLLPWQMVDDLFSSLTETGCVDSTNSAIVSRRTEYKP